MKCRVGGGSATGKVAKNNISGHRWVALNTSLSPVGRFQHVPEILQKYNFNFRTGNIRAGMWHHLYSITFAKFTYGR